MQKYPLHVQHAMKKRHDYCKAFSFKVNRSVEHKTFLSSSCFV